jgi:hypothetical protein
VLSDVSEIDSLQKIDLEYLFKKILHFRSAVTHHSFFSLLYNCLIAEVLSSSAKLCLLSAGWPSWIHFYLENDVLKGNSRLSMKKNKTPKAHMSTS